MANKARIIPVIHVLNFNQAATNIDVCITNGIDKVFLINMAISPDELITIYTQLKVKYPNQWMGLNLLGLSAKEAWEKVENLTASALWTDDGGAIEKKYVGRNSHHIAYFGGFAFKYQKQPKDIESEVKEAMKYIDVITTSGSSTGKAAPVEKVQKIRSLIGTHQLALASGVNKDNIKEFSKYVDYFLVASSITSPTEMIVEEKLKELIEAIL